MIAVPSIDLLNGSVVRLDKGDYSKAKVYSSDPLQTASVFDSAGLKYLHLVDLDASRKDKDNLGVLKTLASRTSLIIDYGGGIRSEDDAEKVFSFGADSVNVGSLAVTDRNSVIEIERKHPGKVIISADCRNGTVRFHGWLRESGRDVIEFIESYYSAGLRRFTVTDILTDGTLSGPNIEIYEKIISRFPEIILTSSGGVSSRKDLENLSRIGCSFAIVGRAYYEGLVTVDDMGEVGCFPRE